MMNLDLSDIISIIGLLAGGGGVGFFMSWRYTRRKEKAEADVAETTAAKEIQDMYQQALTDMKADREEQRQYICELKDDRRHLRQERDELRKRIDKTDEMVHDLQREVARNGRMVESLRPFICMNTQCKERVQGVVMGDGIVKKSRTKKENKDESKQLAN